MRSLKQLLYTKAPSSSKLLDIAIILAVIPHLFVMKFFMLLYILVAVVFILKNKTEKKYQYILMIVGIILISISFFNNYNFSNFSRMQFFVSLVSSLLIYAITLQKLNGEINVYLKISPALLMLLSFFFFESITMLIYAVFVLFLFVMLNIWSRMDAELIDLLKLTSRLFVLSIPVVVILFLVFPRISFKKADFGFRADEYTFSGYDGKMNVSSKGVLLSNKVVMEVYFEDDSITDGELYFRGSTLYEDDGITWSKPDDLIVSDKISNIKNIKNYDITLYPHGDNWIYALDVPIAAPPKTVLENDYTLRSEKTVFKKKKYRLGSALSYKLSSSNYSNALAVDIQKNDQTYKALEHIRVMDIDKYEKAMMLLIFFKEQKLSYKLQPANLDEKDLTDSFLFEGKNGYCVHFASAFAKSARMLNIPSRIVTGYKADKENMINKYLVVRDKNAHAWVELYFEKKGWVRFEPTATALKTTQTQQEQAKKQSSFFTEINLQFMYVKYLIDKWVLGYDRLKQLDILKSLLNDTVYMIKFLLSVIAVFLVTFLIYINIKNFGVKDQFMSEVHKLLKFLNKYGLVKKENEPMQNFLLRAEDELGVSFKNISNIYHKEKYGKKDTNNNLEELRVEVKKMMAYLPIASK
ncbi:transglutaminaseTgpA domain-containing protein [Sulfurimonas sp.]|uniref:transglutaminase family protein n=1 Tax=Sulfurimonas sp. TaxID=2022749 RepID=UPI00356437EB